MSRRKVMARKHSERPIRSAIFSVIFVAVLGTSIYLFVSALQSRVPTAATNTIDISANMGGFSQNEVRLIAGEAITIRLTSTDNRYHTDGGGQHQWAVDELGVNVIAPPLGSESVTFTPDKPGTYTFYCDICCGGRVNPTMNGTLVVEA